MAESIRAILAETDVVIARVRTRLGGTNVPDAPSDSYGTFVTFVTSDETAVAMRIADDWAAESERLVQERRIAEAATDFRAKWPALVRWRDRTLGNQKRAKPALVAAAYELLALECTLGGQWELAAKSQQAAIDVMRSRARVVPIRSTDRHSSAALDAAAQSA